MKKLTKASQSLTKKTSDSLTAGFIAFLKNYGIIGLAIAVIIGGAVSKLVTALVTDIIMPLITFFIPNGNWRSAQLVVGPIIFALGDFVGSLLDFLIIASVIYIIAKWILQEDVVTKK